MPDGSGEQLWAETSGVVDGIPARLRLTDAGLSLQLEHEPEPRSIPLRDITDLTARIGVLTGYLTLSVGEETIIVARVPKAEARALTEGLRAQLRHLPEPEQEPEPQITAPTSAGDGSPLAELERLGRLRASGVLTDEEFEAAKRTLLGRL